MKLGEASHVQASACLACGHRLDAATVVNEDGTTVRPERSDFTVCIACGYLMVFDDELRLRELTGEEMKQIAGDKRILAIQRAREKLPIKTYTGNTWGR